jgi:hypothetical protein
MHRWNNKQLIYDSAGEPLAAETTERLSTLLWEIIEEAFNFSKTAHEKDGGKSIPREHSLHDFVKAKAADLVADEVERSLLIQMSEMFGAYVGEPIWKQSLRFAWMEECCGGGAYLLSLLFETRRKVANTLQRSCSSSQTIPVSLDELRSPLWMAPTFCWERGSRLSRPLKAGFQDRRSRFQPKTERHYRSTR